MSQPDNTNPPPKGQFLVYPTEDGQTKIEVRLENETVWLTQQQMAELFQTTQQNISLHLQNTYEEGELQRAATHKEYLSVRLEGNRQVKRPLDYYNLDAIISVGYRVKSAVATRFRIWATQKLRDFRAVPEKYRTLVPEYVKDYVSLNQFAARGPTHAS